jgi:SAM-dependent methyltransferase
LVARVEALDFSAVMLTELRARLAARGITNVGVQQGDGQVLPYADASFDKAFSMFGLMFFPDRARGFAELRRVLRVGGRALVSSWQSAARVPALLAVFEAMAAELPTLPQSSGKAPLSDPDEFRVEMSAAGFEVQVHEVIHAVEAESLERFWRGMRRSLAPLVLLEHKLGPEPFDALAKGIYRRLRERLGDGPLRMEMPAWLGVGRAV